MFSQILASKAEWARKRVGGVNPAYTLPPCRTCGHSEKGNRLSQSRFVCRQCGHTGNADVNAAWNILARAVPSV
ncbi:zinc ribbon domain-containing protein [Deinococcus sp. NW-56]|uniref:zinc ribbon domain-containing protein n=1 Tax=Deinococcus sp. NW-56 TaxID=2080419 RepID=UPI000CF4E1E5|nr:zinc ribbon domain-containing protein [Deinococcus sp. NW-56]